MEHCWLLFNMNRRAIANVKDRLSIYNSPWHSTLAVQKIFPNIVQKIACYHWHWTKFIVLTRNFKMPSEICNVAY